MDTRIQTHISRILEICHTICFSKKMQLGPQVVGGSSQVATVIWLGVKSMTNLSTWIKCAESI